MSNKMAHSFKLAGFLVITAELFLVARINAEFIYCGVGILHKELLICSGSNLNGFYILTAASCTHDNDKLWQQHYEVKNLKIIHGDVAKTRKIAVVNIYVHPYYGNVNTAERVPNNIALLKLTTSLGGSLGTCSLPTMPPRYFVLKPQTVGALFFWSLIDSGAGKKMAPLQPHVVVKDEYECIDEFDKHVFIRNTAMHCGGFQNIAAVNGCETAIGGGMVSMEGELMGVLTYREACGDAKTPAAYINVPAQIWFIMKTAEMF